MTTQYILSCHCQTHVYLLDLPAGELEKGGVVCDCSWCLKRRFIWAFLPRELFKLHRGAGKDGAPELAEYRFGKKEAGHKCGTYLIMEPNRPNEDRWFFNLRTIRNPDFDLWKLPLTVVGVLPPHYEEIALSEVAGAEDALTSKAQEMGGETEIYVGSCHCQSVKFAVVCKPLHSPDEKVVDCACSICLGVSSNMMPKADEQNGVVWLYPSPSQVIFHPSEPSNPHKPLASTVVRYTFASGENVHYMCRTCGCHVYEHRESKAESDMGLNVALFSRAKEWVRDLQGIGEGKQQLGVGMRVSTLIGGLVRDDTDRWIEPKYEVKL